MILNSSIQNRSLFQSVVNGRAHINSAQLVGTEDGMSYMPVGDWQAQLSPFYKPLPGILPEAKAILIHN